MSGINTFLRLLQGQQQAAPVPAANMQRPYQLPGGRTPPMALSGLQKAQAAQLARGTGGPAPRVLPMLANVAQGKYISPLQKALMKQEAEQPVVDTSTALQGAGAPAQTTFGQRFSQPTTQALLGAAIQGADASGYSPIPVSTGQVLARMGAGAVQAYGDAEKRMADQQAAAQKAVVDRLLAEAQYAKAMRPETTSLMTNLALAGIDPKSQEGQKIIRDALTKPGTTIMTGGEGEFIKQGIQSGFKLLNAAQEQVETDRAFSTRLQQVIDILSDPNAKTGPIASATMGIRQIGRELGFLNEEQEKTLNSQQVLSAAINYMTPKMRVSGSGSSSDKDVELMRDALPTLSGSPLGNRLIAGLYKKTLDYNKKRVELMGKYLKKEKNLIGFGDWADEQMGALYVRVGGQADINNAISNGTLKEGDVYWNDGAKEFQILEADQPKSSGQ